MGQTESIVGVDDFPPFSEEDKELIECNKDIFECFFRHPTLENYLSIRNIDQIYEKCLGRKYDLYILSVREKNPSFGDPLSRTESEDLHSEIERLMSANALLSASDLDSLWTLYYATGQKEYPQRILFISNDKKQHPFVRMAAGWSYDSNVDQGKL